MIKEIIQQWEQNKDNLRKWFENNNNLNSLGYKEIVEQLFRLVIDGFNTNRITEVDDGEYQGTLIYLIPKDTYQPSKNEYIVTFVDYGSCSYCDTLLNAIIEHEGKERIDLLMTLALHLVQQMKYLYAWTDEMIEGKESDRIEAQKQSPWISVNDRLPDYEDVVLVYNPECGVYFNHRSGNPFTVVTDENDWCVIPIKGNITYWMPIPELPTDKTE